MIKPNFFIVGAPKCGTTALSEYLRSHPQVFMSTPKEPHYFATDMPKFRYVKNIDDYLGLFKETNGDHKAVGDASVWNMYSNEAIRNIHEFNPNSKLIVMIRNPIDLIYSMHSQALASLDEAVKDFSTAWSLSDKRKAGHSVPKNCRDRKILYYNEIGKVGEQLERVFKIFPAEQVKVIFFEDFSSNTKDVYKSVLDFLEIKDDEKDTFPRVNKNEKLRSSSLKAGVQKLPKSLVSLYLGVKKITKFRGFGLIGKTNKWNLVESERIKLSHDMKQQIILEYKEDIKMLGDMTGRDLSEWVL